MTRLSPLSADDPLPPEDRAPAVHGSSLEALYRAQAPGLLRRFSRWAGHDAGDLLHDAFERLARRDDAAPVEQPARFLSRVATNLLRDRAKFAARRAAAFHVSIDEVTLAGRDPHDELEARDMIVRLELAMARLRPRTRDIFFACRLDGCTHAEVAERTGMSVRGVRKQISKAIAEIDRALGSD